VAERRCRHGEKEEREIEECLAAARTLTTYGIRLDRGCRAWNRFIEMRPEAAHAVHRDIHDLVGSLSLAELRKIADLIGDTGPGPQIQGSLDRVDELLLGVSRR
jgi:hypothetical protein